MAQNERFSGSRPDLGEVLDDSQDVNINPLEDLSPEEDNQPLGESPLDLLEWRLRNARQEFRIWDE